MTFQAVITAIITVRRSALVYCTGVPYNEDFVFGPEIVEKLAKTLKDSSIQNLVEKDKAEYKKEKEAKDAKASTSRTSRPSKSSGIAQDPVGRSGVLLTA